MLHRQSLTITGIIITLIMFLGETVGVEVVEADLQTTITTLGQLIGILIAWYGRVRVGDIGWLGKRK